MISAAKALARLKQGNRTFVAGLNSKTPRQPPVAELVMQQQPIAAILGCADARVPAEIVFHQGLGELFVIRVAGNIAAASQIGSVEFAAQALGTRLVVVLGHTECGAVGATVDALLQPGNTLSPNLRAIVEHVRPAVAPLLTTRSREDHAALVQRAVRANVERTVAALGQRSEVLAQLMRDDGLRIVGARYSLTTGEVTFFDATGDADPE